MGKKGVKQGGGEAKIITYNIITCYEINTSIESIILLFQAQCFGKHSVALPGGLGLKGSDTVWVL